MVCLFREVDSGLYEEGTSIDRIGPCVSDIIARWESKTPQMPSNMGLHLNRGIAKQRWVSADLP